MKKEKKTKEEDQLNLKSLGIEFLNLRIQTNSFLNRFGIVTLADILNTSDKKMEVLSKDIVHSDCLEIQKFRQNPIERVNFLMTLRVVESLRFYRRLRAEAKRLKIYCCPLGERVRFRYFQQWVNIPTETFFEKLENERGILEQQFINEVLNDEYPSMKKLLIARQVTISLVKSAVIEDYNLSKSDNGTKNIKIDQYVKFVTNFRR